jgi:hypothetical protein
MRVVHKVKGRQFLLVESSPAPAQGLDDYMSRMRPLVDETVQKLGAAQFRLDPIAGRKYSRATSIMSSAYKRHGAILDRALLERLKDCARLRVWTEDDFKLCHSSLREVRVSERIEPLLRTQLPYGDRERSVRIDVLVFDEEDSKLSAYNVKRGNGSYDGSKRRIIQDETLRSHMLLMDYGRQLGLSPKDGHAHVIFYYGLLSLSPPIAISGFDLDEHFRFPVIKAIESVNSYFTEKLHGLIEKY